MDANVQHLRELIQMHIAETGSVWARRS